MNTAPSVRDRVRVTRIEEFLRRIRRGKIRDLERINGGHCAYRA
jgi:hypothetical protein